jgi:hypothetical protein
VFVLERDDLVAHHDAFMAQLAQRGLTP